MSPDRPRIRSSRGRVALGVGLTAAVLGCGGAFAYGQATGSAASQAPQSESEGGTVGEQPEYPEIDQDFAHELAYELGVAPVELLSALDSVRAGQIHYGGGWGEAAADRHSELADALGLEPMRLQEAFGQVDNDDEEDNQDNEQRTRLVECLDEAVDNGELSEFNRDNILKVHDLGLLGAGK